MKKLNFLIIILSAYYCNGSLAQDIEFNTNFLKDKTDKIVLNTINHGYSITPGTYEFSVYVNKQYAGHSAIKFYESNNKDLQSCFDEEFIKKYNIIFTTNEQKIISNTGCYDLSAIPNFTVNNDFGNQKVSITLPQVNLIKKPRGFIHHQDFDQGINAAIINYSMNTNYYDSHYGDDSYSLNLLLNSGFNLGAWRYRNSGYFTKNKDSGHWQSSSNKIERDIHTSIPMRLQIGDSTSNSNIFDGFNFKGVQLSSDEMQLPNSLQDYAPIVRGVARTHATVEIRQNGYLIYSSNVSPGNFVINDLYSVSDASELEVKVIENDGTVNKFTQYISTISNMVRTGQSKFQLTFGKYRDTNHQFKPYFFEYTSLFGINNYLTYYGGLLFSENYYSFVSGLSASLGNYGALSTDLTYASNQTSDNIKKQGFSAKILYAKSLNSIGTNLKIVGYRYSTKDYYSFSEAVQERNRLKNGNYQYELGENDYFYSSYYYNKKNQFQINLNQNLNDFGQVYLSLSKTDYWKKDYNQESYQLGYNNRSRFFSYGLYFQRNKSALRKHEDILGLNVSFNLDSYLPSSHLNTLSSNYQYSKASGSSLNTSLTGSFFEHNLQTQIQFSPLKNDNVGLNASYRGSKFNSSVGYYHSNNYNQTSASINGGVLIHSNGLTFGQQMYGNSILVEAKGAQGISFENNSNVTVDHFGYAILPNISAYRRNRVALKINDLDNHTQIDNPVVNDLVPTKNAILKVSFDVKKGINVLANITSNGNDIVVGSTILDSETSKVIGMVGLNGQAYLTGVQSYQHLVSKWGEESFEQCQFVLPELKKQEFGYDTINIDCNEL